MKLSARLPLFIPAMADALIRATKSLIKVSLEIVSVNDGDYLLVFCEDGKTWLIRTPPGKEKPEQQDAANKRNVAKVKHYCGHYPPWSSRS